MLAHLLRQAPSLREAFDARIADKRATAHDVLVQRVDARLAGTPKPVRSMIQWGAQMARDHWERQQARHGQQGEQQLTVALRWRLSAAWWLLPDVLLSCDGEHLTQIDCVGVGPPGLFVVEVKRWTGAIRATGDRWARKEGARWMPCESPTRQNAAHVRHVQSWWRAVELGDQVGSIAILPVVVLLETAWLRVSTPQCPCSTVQARWPVICKASRRHGRQRRSRSCPPHAR